MNVRKADLDELTLAVHVHHKMPPNVSLSRTRRILKLALQGVLAARCTDGMAYHLELDGTTLVCSVENAK